MCSLSASDGVREFKVRRAAARVVGARDRQDASGVGERVSRSTAPLCGSAPLSLARAALRGSGLLQFQVNGSGEAIAQVDVEPVAAARQPLRAPVEEVPAVCAVGAE